MKFAPRNKISSSLLMVGLLVIPVAAQQNWPSFRGPSGSGIAEGFPAPVSWDMEKAENIRWKTPIPGLGHSSPVIWGDRIFVTTATHSRARSGDSQRTGSGGRRYTSRRSRTPRLFQARSCPVCGLDTETAT